MVNTKDPWTMELVRQICDIFGMPTTSLECETARERIMFAWSMLHIARSLGQYKDVLELLDDLSPADAAEGLARHLYDSTGELLIPCMPISGSLEAGSSK